MKSKKPAPTLATAERVEYDPHAVWSALKKKSLAEIRAELERPEVVEAQRIKDLAAKEKSIATATKTIMASHPELSLEEASEKATKWFERRFG